MLHNLIYRAAVDGIFELISGVTVGFRHAVAEVAPSDTFRGEASRV